MIHQKRMAKIKHNKIKPKKKRKNWKIIECTIVILFLFVALYISSILYPVISAITALLVIFALAILYFKGRERRKK